MFLVNHWLVSISTPTKLYSEADAVSWVIENCWSCVIQSYTAVLLRFVDSRQGFLVSILRIESAKFSIKDLIVSIGYLLIFFKMVENSLKVPSIVSLSCEPNWFWSMSELMSEIFDLKFGVLLGWTCSGVYWVFWSLLGSVLLAIIVFSSEKLGILIV